MDAIEEEYVEFDDTNNASKMRRNFARRTPESTEIFQIKNNVQRALKDARQKINDLRSEVDRKDELIRQERLFHNSSADETYNKHPNTKSMNMNKHLFEETKSTEDLLHEEVSVLDGLNDRLMEKLARTESRLESAQLHKTEISLETEAKIAARGAALVEKIYKAQKERDAAVLSRLKLANEERDEVLARMKRLENEQQGFDSGVDSVYDDDEQEMSMKQLFNRLVNCDNAVNINKHGDLMVARFRKHGKSKNVMAAEEIQALIDERDEAIEKVKALEKELECANKEKEIVRNQFKMAERTRIKSGQAQLMAAQQDRDQSLHRVKELEDELQNIRVYYSLHRSLSQEQNLKDQFNATMDTFEAKLNERDNELELAQNNTKELVERLKVLAKEKELLSQQLSEAITSQRKEKDRADKLERLVLVLRRRITTSGLQT